jgi:hypothetical protein
MDIHSAGQIPNWDQEMIRKGAANTPAKFLVNFTQVGKYKISLTTVSGQRRPIIEVVLQKSICMI